MRERSQPRSSLRQLKIARERAREVLARFLQAPEMIDPLNAASADLTEFISNGKLILSSIAKEDDPPEAALASLTAALNRPVRGFAWHFLRMDKPRCRVSPDATISRQRYGSEVFISGGPYSVRMDLVRHVAEALREYLQLIPICGLIHSACQFEGCTNVVFGGRGNKKFCSDEHRKAFWNYDRQKEYYQRKQRETYRVRK